MKKKSKNLNTLILILREEKNVRIDVEDYAVEYLTRNSYYNFINSTKIHFIDYENTKEKKVYLNMNFVDWVKVYEKNIKFESKLLEICLREEECLTNFIGNLVHENNSNNDFVDIVYKKLSETKIVKSKFKKSEEKNDYYKNTIIDSTWAFIHEVMLGDKKEIVSYMSGEDKLELNNLLIINIDDDTEFKAFKDLRNSLAHNTPLNIYLTSAPSKKERAARYKVVNKLANTKGSGIKKVADNIKLCKKYIKLK